MSKGFQFSTAYIQEVFDTRDQLFGVWPVSSQHFSIAGHSVHCHFTDSRQQAFMLPALAHHPEIPEHASGLNLYIWDEASTGVSMPKPPIDLPWNEGWQYNQGRFFGISAPFQYNSIWFDRERNEGIFITRDLRDVGLAERSAPFLYIWSAWLGAKGLHVAHSAALCGRQGAALLIGAAGTGKSSTALRSFQSALGYLADDYCLIEPEPEPKVHSLFSSGKVFMADRKYYPELEQAVVGENGEKTIYQFMPSQVAKLRQSAPLITLLAVTRTGSVATTVRPISKMETIKKVAPNTLLQVRYGNDSRQILDAIVSLTQRVECLELNLGSDRFEVVSVLEDMLN